MPSMGQTVLFNLYYDAACFPVPAIIKRVNGDGSVDLHAFVDATNNDGVANTEKTENQPTGVDGERILVRVIFRTSVEEGDDTGGIGNAGKWYPLPA